MKKKISVLIIIMAFIIGIGISVDATEIDYTSENLSCYKENPLYANENITNNKSKLRTSVSATTKNAVALQEYEQNSNNISKDVRDYMVKRTQSFTIYSKLTLNEEINNDIFKEYIDNVIKNAMSEELANSSSAGDYLKWSWENYEVSPSAARCIINRNTYTYYMDLVFYFNYYTTYDQEQELNSDIQFFINNNINKSGDSIYDKVVIIYKFITSNVKYDDKNLNDETYKLKYTAYAAMENKTSVCQGYATLFYKMVKESNVNDVRIITGSNHAWNIVKIGPMYYNLDSTWDAGKSYFTYFLKGANLFNNLSNHTRESEYCTESFRRTYPTSSKDYDANKLYIDINECKINNLSNYYTYTSKSIVPKITVTYEDYVLAEGKDYTIKYENNIMPGIAEIEINGLGYFEGKRVKTFNINPAKISGFKLSKSYTNKVQLKWNKQAGVTSYRIYKYNTKTKKYDYIKSTGSTTCYITGLSAGNTYCFRIRATKKTSSGTLYGAYTYVDVATLPNKVTLSSVKSGSKKMTVKWKKVSACTGYEIQYSTSSKFTSSKTKKLTINNKKTVSKTIKGLKRRQKYYVRVRAYTMVNGKKYYGSYSKVKIVRVR